MKRLLHSRHCNRHLRKCFRDSWLPTHYPLVPSSLAFRTTFPGFLYREVWPCEQCWPVKHKGTGLKWPLSFDLLLAWKADVMSGAAAAILRLIMGAGSPWATFLFCIQPNKILDCYVEMVWTSGLSLPVSSHKTARVQKPVLFSFVSPQEMSDELTNEWSSSTFTTENQWARFRVPTKCMAGTIWDPATTTTVVHNELLQPWKTSSAEWE